MSIRTSGVGASRKLEFWDQYGVKKYDFSPTEMLTPGPVLFELEKILVTDTDVTPVGNVLLKVLDKVPYFRDEADAIDIILPEEDIPHHLVDAVELDSLLTINAGIALKDSTAPLRLEVDGDVLEIWGGLTDHGGGLFLFGPTAGISPGAAVISTPDAGGAAAVRLTMEGMVAAPANVTWTNCVHIGLVLGANLDANGFAIVGLAATSFGDDVALGFGDGPEGLLVWDTTDIDAMLLKVELPTAAAGDVPVLVAGIGIIGVDLGFFDTLTEPVAALVDIAQTSWVTFGFGAAATPELNCGGVATAIRLGVPFDMNTHVIGGLGAPVAQDDALRKERAEIIDTDVDATSVEVLSHKGAVAGYCPLEAGLTTVPLANIPTPLTAKDADTVDGVEGADIIVRGGTVPFTGNQDMGTNKLTGLAAPGVAGDALRYDELGVANGIATLDALGDVLLAQIPDTLTGKDADTVDTIEGADIILRDGTVAFTGPVPTGAAGALTIDGAGAIAVTKSFHKVDTNLGGATDDLDNITGGTEGDILVLKATDGAHTVVVRDFSVGGGNLRLDGSANFSLDSAEDSIMLIYDGANWLEIARSNNGA